VNSAGRRGADADAGAGRERRNQRGSERKDPKSPVAGMPILEAYKAKSIVVDKRWMASGYTGLDNDLFYQANAMMAFGHARQVIDSMVNVID
jgi:NAD(P) transhydrogenase subunit beta